MAGILAVPEGATGQPSQGAAVRVMTCFPAFLCPVFCATQCWAVLEARLGNTDRARKLFDAATAADERHAAAWHGWAMLELRAGNTGRARQLLEKGAKFCGESAYIYQVQYWQVYEISIRNSTA